MMCNLLSSPKASGVGPTLAKEKVLDLLFLGCEHRQGQLKNLQETDRAGHHLGARPAEHLRDGVVLDKRLLTTRAPWRQVGLFVWWELAPLRARQGICSPGLQ